MPIFKSHGKTYNNPVEFALDLIGGRWKMPILWRLDQRESWRYGELKRDMPGISHKMLSLQLKELERDGLVDRKQYPTVPPKVEYRITKIGRSSIPAIEAMRTFGNTLKKKSL
jgi:DNA-binding HxlR family transcriptional regulator